MISIKITTNQKEELLDVTPVIKDAVNSSGINNGLCIVFVPHTTAGITINENADPSENSTGFPNLHPCGRKFPRSYQSQPDRFLS